MDTNKHEAVGRARHAVRAELGLTHVGAHRLMRPPWLFVVLVLVCFTVNALAQRERITFNDGWRFTKGDPENSGASLSYTNLKTWILPSGNAFRATNSFPRPTDEPLAVSFAQLDFNDTSWCKLNLPHDWGIEGPFQQEYPGETGKLPWWGVAWYRKQFTLPASDAGKRIVLEVDGAMSYASVWLNGKLIGGWPYGYASWQLDLTPFVKVGGENVLAIRLDNPKDSSRWYPGGGIYRNVWLTKTELVHFQSGGIVVTTPQITTTAATVRVDVTVANDSPAHAGQSVSLQTRLFECDSHGSRRGKPVAEITVAKLDIGPTSQAKATMTATIPKPKTWSVSRPSLYVAETIIEQRGKVIDRVETTFGIRTIEFTANNGFLLNGQRVAIQGVCQHHDLGALGAAFNTRAAERQLEILREMGVNAIRTAHNPPAPELLELCDRMGFLVMVEAFDCWKGRKKPNDYHLLFADWSEADLRAMVRHFRNHPSVIVWSTGNEMPDQRNAQGVELSKKLTAIVHEEDPTRPVTAGCNHDIAGFNGFQNTVDIFGYNYKPHLYAKFRATNSLVPLYGSETASTVSTRGEYFFPVSDDKLQGLADFQVSSYDLYAPRWAMTPETEFRGQDTNTYIAGEFVWTGFDYLGEPTPYNSDLSNLNNYSNVEDKLRAEKELAEMGKIRTPSRSSYFGIVDLAGFKKDRFYLYQSRWRPELRMAHILPHWNWPGREGEVTPVHVYTSGDEAELFLNGQSLGRKKKATLEYRLRWNDVKYAPGELKVVAYKNGKKWATDVVLTAGLATKLMLEADRSTIAADGRDLSFITVTVADKKGQLVPRAKNQLKFEIEGPGEIIATDNGDPTSFESFQAPERKAFNGLALVIVRAKAGQSGKIKLIARSEGLTSESVTIRAK